MVAIGVGASAIGFPIGALFHAPGHETPTGP
jgi:hypothetical protein